MPSTLKRRANDELPGSHATRRRRRSSDSSHGSVDEAVSGPTIDSFTSHEPMVKKLVRLALASEISRKPLRRVDISEKILSGSSGRNFKPVFEAADKRLRKVFGMTLVELPQKERTTIAQKRAAQRSGTHGTSATQDKNAAITSGTRNFILVSVLSEQYKNRTIIHPSQIPTAGMEAGYAGICTFVISTIMLSNGQRISEGKLLNFLQRASADETVLGDKTERIIKRMERDGYIDRIKEEDQVDYKIGSRGRMEVGNEGVAGMVRAIYRESGDDLKRLEEALERSLGTNTFVRYAGRDQQAANDATVSDMTD